MTTLSTSSMKIENCYNYFYFFLLLKAREKKRELQNTQKP